MKETIVKRLFRKASLFRSMVRVLLADVELSPTGMMHQSRHP